MSKNQLPVTDLANICTLPEGEQWRRLELKRAFAPPYSLDFTRRNLGMLLGVSDPLFPDAVRPPKAEILSRFEAVLPKGPKRAERERKANLARAEALLEFRDDHVGRAANETHRAFTVSEGTFVRTADPVNLEVDGRPCIISSDLRKSGSLTDRGLSVYFSMNFHMIVDYDPTFSGFDLLHLDFWQSKDGSAGIATRFHSGEPRYSYDELNRMIRRTLALWNEVIESRRTKTQASDDGFWFGQAG